MITQIMQAKLLNRSMNKRQGVPSHPSVPQHLLLQPMQQLRLLRTKRTCGEHLRSRGGSVWRGAAVVLLGSGFGCFAEVGGKKSEAAPL